MVSHFNLLSIVSFFHGCTYVFRWICGCLLILLFYFVSRNTTPQWDCLTLTCSRQGDGKCSWYGCSHAQPGPCCAHRVLQTALCIRSFFLLPFLYRSVQTWRLPDKELWQQDIKLLAVMAGRHILPHSHEELGSFEVFIAGRVMNWLKPSQKQEVFFTSSSPERSLLPNTPY